MAYAPDDLPHYLSDLEIPCRPGAATANVAQKQKTKLRQFADALYTSIIGDGATHDDDDEDDQR